MGSVVFPVEVGRTCTTRHFNTQYRALVCPETRYIIPIRKCNTGYTNSRKIMSKSNIDMICSHQDYNLASGDEQTSCQTAAQCADGVDDSSVPTRDLRYTITWNARNSSNIP